MTRNNLIQPPEIPGLGAGGKLGHKDTQNAREVGVLAPISLDSFLNCRSAGYDFQQVF